MLHHEKLETLQPIIIRVGCEHSILYKYQVTLIGFFFIILVCFQIKY
jgi:hypothetical protein